MTSKGKKIACVLGMHRSGTSAISKFIVQSGYSAGGNLMPPNEENEEGYFEDLDIYRLNQSILNFLYLSWDSTEDLKYRKINIIFDLVWEKYGEKAISLVKTKLKEDNNLLIKDPRITVLIPFWEKVFNNSDATVSYILSVRNPLDVAKSLQKRNNFSLNYSFNLWFFYYASCLKELNKKVFIIHFEDLAKLTDNQAKLLADFLKVEKDNIKAACTKALNPNIIHHKTSTKIINREITNHPELKLLYKFLLSESILERIPLELTNNIVGDEKPDSALLTSSIFLSNVQSEKMINKHQIQKKHGNGNVKLVFENKNDEEFNEFNLFICDKPCLIKIKEFSITTRLSQKIMITEFESNALYRKNEYLIFDNNTPEIKFKSENHIGIKDIELECFINTEPELLTGLIIPIQNYIFSDKKEEINKLMQQKKIIQTKIQEHEKSTEQLMQSNEQLKQSSKQLKQDNEQLRQSNEQFKQSSKQLKQDNEQLRQSNEQFKQSSEQLRQSNQQFKQSNEQLKQDYEQLKQSNEHLKQLINESENRNETLQNALNSIVKSLSWKLTIPVRFAGKITYAVFPSFRRIKEGVITSAGILKNQGVKEFGIRFYRSLERSKTRKDLQNLQSPTQTEIIDTSKKIIVPSFESPLVSIIIPVFNQWGYTYQCIKSVVDNTINTSYEIIVADDVSTDKTKSIKKYIKNIKVIRNKENLKFVRNNNNAARYATGKFLLFLNNDTQVHENWLKPMIEVFNSHEKVGIVGSKLVYPDLTLQEAGGIIWNDGSGWNYGRQDKPDKPEYNFVRETDFVSGASLMIDCKLWQKLNGFDEYFAPAYYEDTDLAFRAREAGYKVIYQPQSVITHFEGISNGKDVNEGVKMHQVENAKKFVERWDRVLKEENFPNGKDVFIAKDRSRNKQHVLVIDHYVPHFDQDAGSRSTYSYLLLLIKMGCKVTFIGDNFYKHEPYTSILQQKGVEVLYGNEYCNNIHQWLKENGKYFTHVFLHRMHIAPKYLDTVKKHTSAKLIYIGHDLQFISSRRKYELTKETGHLTDSEIFKANETKIFNKVDAICPFSTYEAPFIQEIVPHKQVVTIPVYFFEKIYENTGGFEQRKDILFVGGFGHPPNKGALLWFVNEIFPIVKKQFKSIKLHVVGSKPSAEVKALASESINVTGFVPDDELERYYQTCRVSVIPLLYGAGVKGKLIETCYYQLPPVITPVAAEGIPDIEKYCIIEQEPEKFANRVIDLYKNKDFWAENSIKCRQLIENNFTEEATKKKMQQIF